VEETSTGGSHVAGVCGLYCGACTLYRARHDVERKDAQAVLEKIAERWKVPVEQVVCEGCLSQGPISGYCAACEIKKCAASKPGVTRCADCDDFPCDLLMKFANDGVPHHSAVLKNVRRQRKIGIREWVEEEYERDRCQYCGVSLDWYAGVCHRCGTQNASSITSVMGERLQPHYRA